jgi:hypothetical protein
MTVLLAMLVCRHSLKPQRPVPATVLVVSWLDSMQDAQRFYICHFWVRGGNFGRTKPNSLMLSTDPMGAG